MRASLRLRSGQACPHIRRQDAAGTTAWKAALQRRGLAARRQLSHSSASEGGSPLAIPCTATVSGMGRGARLMAGSPTHSWAWCDVLHKLSQDDDVDVPRSACPTVLLGRERASPEETAGQASRGTPAVSLPTSSATGPRLAHTQLAYRLPVAGGARAIVRRVLASGLSPREKDSRCLFWLVTGCRARTWRYKKTPGVFFRS